MRALQKKSSDREEARVAHARRYLNRDAIVTEAGREAQIQRLLSESSGTLSQLVWPAGVHTVDAMLTYLRELPTGRDISKAAAASRQATTKKSQASRKSKPRGIKPARNYVGPKTKSKGFSDLMTEMRARWILATGEQAGGHLPGIYAMVCRRCDRRGLVYLHPSSFRHSCPDGTPNTNAKDDQFEVRVLRYSWEVKDWLLSNPSASCPTGTAPSYSMGADETMEGEGGRRIKCWRAATGLPEPIVRDLTAESVQAALALARAVRRLPSHILFDYEIDQRGQIKDKDRLVESLGYAADAAHQTTSTMVY